MIFERRAYTLRPGKVDAFWKAQSAWNTEDVFGEILDRNISYFTTMAGDSDQIVHLYRFDSTEHWRDCYERYYRAQSPEYFKLVRPWMLAQENSFFAAPPIVELAKLWTADTAELPCEFKPLILGDVLNVLVEEEVVDFLPGGLIAYWDAYREYGLAAASMSGRRPLMATLVSIVGRLHRIVHYRCFLSLVDSQAHKAGLDANPNWRRFVESYQSLVAGGRTSILRPAGLARNSKAQMAVCKRLQIAQKGIF